MVLASPVPRNGEELNSSAATDPASDVPSAHALSAGADEPATTPAATEPTRSQSQESQADKDSQPAADGPKPAPPASSSGPKKAPATFQRINATKKFLSMASGVAKPAAGPTASSVVAVETEKPKAPALSSGAAKLVMMKGPSSSGIASTSAGSVWNRNKAGATAVNSGNTSGPASAPSPALTTASGSPSATMASISPRVAPSFVRTSHADHSRPSPMSGPTPMESLSRSKPRELQPRPDGPNTWSSRHTPAPSTVPSPNKAPPARNSSTNKEEQGSFCWADEVDDEESINPALNPPAVQVSLDSRLGHQENSYEGARPQPEVNSPYGAANDNDYSGQHGYQAGRHSFGRDRYDNRPDSGRDFTRPPRAIPFNERGNRPSFGQHGSAAPYSQANGYPASSPHVNQSPFQNFRRQEPPKIKMRERAADVLHQSSEMGSALGHARKTSYGSNASGSVQRPASVRSEVHSQTAPSQSSGPAQPLREPVQERPTDEEDQVTPSQTSKPAASKPATNESREDAYIESRRLMLAAAAEAKERRLREEAEEEEARRRRCAEKISKLGLVPELAKEPAQPERSTEPAVTAPITPSVQSGALDQAPLTVESKTKTAAEAEAVTKTKTAAEAKTVVETKAAIETKEMPEEPEKKWEWRREQPVHILRRSKEPDFPQPEPAKSLVEERIVTVEDSNSLSQMPTSSSKFSISSPPQDDDNSRPTSLQRRSTIDNQFSHSPSHLNGAGPTSTVQQSSNGQNRTPSRPIAKSQSHTPQTAFNRSHIPTVNTTSAPSIGPAASQSAVAFPATPVSGNVWGPPSASVNRILGNGTFGILRFGGHEQGSNHPAPGGMNVEGPMHAMPSMNGLQGIIQGPHNPMHPTIGSQHGIPGQSHSNISVNMSVGINSKTNGLGMGGMSGIPPNVSIPTGPRMNSNEQQYPQPPYSMPAPNVHINQGSKGPNPNAPGFEYPNPTSMPGLPTINQGGNISDQPSQPSWMSSTQGGRPGQITQMLTSDSNQSHKIKPHPEGQSYPISMPVGPSVPRDKSMEERDQDSVLFRESALEPVPSVRMPMSGPVEARNPHFAELAHAPLSHLLFDQHGWIVPGGSQAILAGFFDQDYQTQFQTGSPVSDDSHPVSQTDVSIKVLLGPRDKLDGRKDVYSSRGQWGKDGWQARFDSLLRGNTASIASNSSLGQSRSGLDAVVVMPNRLLAKQKAREGHFFVATAPLADDEVFDPPGFGSRPTVRLCRMYGRQRSRLDSTPQMPNMSLNLPKPLPPRVATIPVYSPRPVRPAQAGRGRQERPPAVVRIPGSKQGVVIRNGEDVKQASTVIDSIPKNVVKPTFANVAGGRVSSSGLPSPVMAVVPSISEPKRVVTKVKESKLESAPLASARKAILPIKTARATVTRKPADRDGQNTQKRDYTSRERAQPGDSRAPDGRANVSSDPKSARKPREKPTKQSSAQGPADADPKGAGASERFSEKVQNTKATFVGSRRQDLQSDSASVRGGKSGRGRGSGPDRARKNDAGEGSKGGKTAGPRQKTAQKEVTATAALNAVSAPAQASASVAT